MKYGIQLISTYTGDHVAYLGTYYDTPKEAQKAFKKEHCTDCNRMQLMYLKDDEEYIDRNTHPNSKRKINGN